MALSTHMESEHVPCSSAGLIWTFAEARAFRSSAVRLSEGPPCGTACATPTKCAPESTAKADIAHKAVGSAGATYGYSKKFAEGWDRIFAKGQESAAGKKDLES
ncbi:unnamed protein product [Effrenium voratum]|nr:unnamed protein product [Effrenium voratum]